MPSPALRSRPASRLEANSRALMLRHCRSMLADCQRLLESLDEDTDSSMDGRLPEGLSERDIALIHWVCHRENWPYPYIAASMHLKMATFHRVRRKVFKAFGVNCRIDLVRRIEDAVGSIDRSASPSPSERRAR